MLVIDFFVDKSRGLAPPPTFDNDVFLGNELDDEVDGFDESVLLVDEDVSSAKVSSPSMSSTDKSCEDILTLEDESTAIRLTLLIQDVWKFDPQDVTLAERDLKSGNFSFTHLKFYEVAHIKQNNYKTFVVIRTSKSHDHAINF